MPQHAQNVVRRFVDQRLDKTWIVVGQRQVDHHLDRMLAARPRRAAHGRIVPLDALHREQIGIVRLARIGGRRAAALERHCRAASSPPRPRPAAPHRRDRASRRFCSSIGKARRSRQRRQHVERQIGLQREDRVDRRRRALAEHAAARRDRVVDIIPSDSATNSDRSPCWVASTPNMTGRLNAARPAAAGRGTRDAAGRWRCRARPGRCRRRVRPWRR